MKGSEDAKRRMDALAVLVDSGPFTSGLNDRLANGGQLRRRNKGNNTVLAGVTQEHL